MKSSGWNRLLIALSGAWIVWSGFNILAHYPAVTPQFASLPTPNIFFDVVATGHNDQPFHVVTHYLAIVGYACLPLAVLWLFAAVARWIARGFRKNDA
ncbi:hypothetical protein [Dyella sp.]|uniref:hypothetical protein n=1 Tax=Dyella sp. TaxID=1869338 RepID=UPI002D7934E7|nr:hypothetical protein [Dyella sp.]HET6431110.1 hypothetical protein [Dyella sp.]